MKIKDADIDSATEQGTNIAEEMKAKDNEIDTVQVAIDGKQKIVDGNNLNALKSQRVKIGKEIGDFIDKRKHF